MASIGDRGLTALLHQYTAQVEVAIVNLDNYMENPVALAEHPDLVVELDKIVTEIAALDEKIQTITKLVEKRSETK